MIKLLYFAGILWCTFSCQAIAENFKWKTESPARNFKCTSQDTGGFLFQQDGNHTLTRFTGTEEFYLTHISEIPDKAFSGPESFISGNTVNENKEAFERYHFKDKRPAGVDDYISESGAFFIRKPGQNPKKFITYFFNSACEYFKNKLVESISCFTDESSKTFNFNPSSGRFSYTYSGSWERPRDEYPGDSAFIAFGECKEYYN